MVAIQSNMKKHCADMSRHGPGLCNHFGKICSDSTKMRIGNANRGRKPSIKAIEETRRLRNGKTYEEIYGTEKADKVRNKQSESHKEYKCSEETKLKISIASKGRKKSIEHRATISKVVKKHCQTDLPNCKCAIHNNEPNYSGISSLTWMLADVLTNAGFEMVIAEEQFGRYRVDALLAEEWIGFEADGYYHFISERQEYDKQRDKNILKRFGLPIVRLTGEEVKRLYNNG